MKNITLTLNDDVLERARVEVAREGKSLSRFVAGIVERRVGRRKTQIEVVEAWLAGAALFVEGESGTLPGRAEPYDDAGLHRRERADIHQELPGPDEAGNRDDMAGGSRRAGARRREPTGSE